MIRSCEPQPIVSIDIWRSWQMWHTPWRWCIMSVTKISERLHRRQNEGMGEERHSIYTGGELRERRGKTGGTPSTATRPPTLVRNMTVKPKLDNPSKRGSYVMQSDKSLDPPSYRYRWTDKKLEYAFDASSKGEWPFKINSFLQINHGSSRFRVTSTHTTKSKIIPTTVKVLGFVRSKVVSGKTTYCLRWTPMWKTPTTIY